MGAGESIAKTYTLKDFQNKIYGYEPHVHIEIWKTCSTTDRHGYDPAGGEFQQAVNQLLVDPNHFPTLDDLPPIFSQTDTSAKTGVNGGFHYKLPTGLAASSIGDISVKWGKDFTKVF